VETDEFIFTHANYLPEAPMDAQPTHQLRWALFDPGDMRPHVSGKPVTVGHTEQPGGEIHDLGFAACIDTACWRYGWLTAVDRVSGQVWQASRWGILREPGEASRRDDLTRLLRKGGS
jgi:serine/threonine protein phosphatase 1